MNSILIVAFFSGHSLTEPASTHTQFMTKFLFISRRYSNSTSETIFILHNIEIANDIDDRPTQRQRQTDRYVKTTNLKPPHNYMYYVSIEGNCFKSFCERLQSHNKRTNVQYCLMCLCVCALYVMPLFTYSRLCLPCRVPMISEWISMNF